MIVVEETLNKNWYWWPLFPLYPYGKKKTILRELIPDQIWSLEQIQGLYYVAVPIRMTVIKVDNGLMLINPLPPTCLLYTSPSPRDLDLSRMPSSA